MAFDEALADRIRRLLPAAARRLVEEKRMFGGLALLYQGRMFCGIVKSDLMLKLGDAGALAALAEPHVRPMDFTGKPSKSMVYVAPAGLDTDDALAAWLARALDFAATTASPRTAASTQTASRRRPPKR